MVDVAVKKPYDYYADYIIIGHTILTHLRLLKGEEPPVCIPCHKVCTVGYLLTKCTDLVEWRNNFITQKH